MKSKNIFVLLLFVLIAGLVIGGTLYFRGVKKKEVIVRGNSRLDQIFADTTVPEDWVQAGGLAWDLIGGTRRQADGLDTGELRFFTSATGAQVLSSYRQFGAKKGWQLLESPGTATTLSFQVSLEDNLRVEVEAPLNQNETIVRLIRTQVSNSQ